MQAKKLVLDISLKFCHLPTEPAPNFNSLSNCSPDKVPSMASQFSLNTEYALGSQGRRVSLLILVNIK